ncbi:bifunctional DedA family/phosphatase PAP2 family protein [Psychrobacillus sp. NPDC058041]|uniref:bifunctional DedA family/phosphatase PAP2 family protein n=1 Tax=Psychrobacillus sp. NPDC058041 TaxID=3346310 RepID=UPI0036DED85E
MAHFIQSLMEQYGYYVLGISLFLELLALPLPGEVLMTYAGMMVFQGHFSLVVSILTAGIGTSFGMTISYWIGMKLGPSFFEKHGHKIHFGPEKLKKTSVWFERFGVKLLVIAFFIPGIRHITGYFSGITRMPFRTYALYAYIGAFLWVSTFISLGKILGPKWELYHQTISKYLVIIGIILVFLTIIYFLFNKYQEKLYVSISILLNKLIETFRSLRKVRFLLLFSFILFLTLFFLMVGLIQDFLANEFAEFDNITTFIVHSIFDESWKAWMTRFSYLDSIYLLFTISLITFIFIMIQKENRLLDASFYLFVLLGGSFLTEILSNFFLRVGPSLLPESFPSEQTLMTVTFFGFTSFLLARYIHIAWIKTGAFLLVIGVSFLVGLSQIYFNNHFPSDVVAGYIFGGVWVSLNVVLLEIFRFVKLESMKSNTKED